MSRKPEQKAWDTFKRNSDSAAGLRLWRIENLVATGMADVYGINGYGTSMWLEFKSINEWPKRAATCPMKSIFEPGQVPFLKQIAGMRGHAYVVLRVVEWDEWFLIWPKCIVELVDMTRKDIETLSAKIGLKNIIQELEYLT